MIELVIRRTALPTYRFTDSGVIGQYLERGIENLPHVCCCKTASSELIVDYILYQLYIRRGMMREGRWQPAMLFSSNASDRYRKQFLEQGGKAGIRYFIDRWLDEAELTRGELVRMIAPPKPSPLKDMVYLESEESVKKRFLNTPDGLALCQNSTTGWSPLSPTCDKCDNWIECGKMTAAKFPELMRYRKNAYVKHKK